MSLICIHPETREEPGEYESDNPATCYVCGDEFDLDDDEYAEAETPLGLQRFCMRCVRSENGIIRPLLMCACGEDELSLVRRNNGWETSASVVVYEGKLWSEECAKTDLLRQFADSEFLTKNKLTELRDKARRLRETA